MSTALKSFDWKLILFVLVACYVVPGIAIAGVLAVIKDTLSPDLWTLVTAVLSIVGFLAPPVSGGYLCARFAKTQAWGHVLVVGVVGALLSLLAFRATPRAMLLYALASVALAAFGAYIRLQGRAKG